MSVNDSLEHVNFNFNMLFFVPCVVMKGNPSYAIIRRITAQKTDIPNGVPLHGLRDCVIPC